MALFVSLLLEETLMAALPSPWQEISLPLVFGIVLMYRVSLSLGNTFILVAALLLYMDGMTSGDVLMAYVVAALAATFVANRIFARRSLAALAGFALMTSIAFALTRLITVLVRSALAGTELMLGVSLVHLIFTVSLSTVLVLALSLPLVRMRDMFGRRFIRKGSSYEVGRGV